MNNFKKFIKKYFSHFVYFFQRLRYRIFIAMALSIIVGALDGLGLAMFLPLLQMVDGEGGDPEAMGSLRFLVDGMEFLNIPLVLSSVLVVMLIFFILKGIAKFFESFYNVILTRFFIKELRFENIDALTSYSFKAFVNSDVGHLQNTLSGEIGRVVGAYRAYFKVIQASVMVLVYIFLAFMANPQFAILVSIGGGLSNLAYQQIYKKTKENSNQLVKGNSGFQGQLIQIIAFFKYFKATGLAKIYGNKLKITAENIEAIQVKMGWYNTLLQATREPLVVGVVIGVILIQTTLMGQSLGLIILALLFFYRSLTFLMALQMQWNQFLNNSGSLENMTSFMIDLKSNSDHFGHVKIKCFQEELRLQDVNFGYGEDSKVLKDINLSISKNRSIAFVGESGSGKTTLINILSGLIPIDDGKFFIDKIDSMNIHIPSYQRRIGYITQEPVIFSDDIYNNVTFWADRSEENVSKFWKAVERAAIANFIKELPQKDRTLLGNNGILVSGGQKQRISIARELYKDIDILIMDEATSALDSETEQAIQENVDALKGKYTILIVAHRLATIKNMDRVILLKNGRIVGDGSFNELKSSSEEFDKMVNLQEI
ncbi:antibiotic ABC transporter ATP-binding protein [Marivirga lumbricoides]|uniref:Antibiotic ABC transporter ATP-binding protein n=1 Tax=Marivirga lumbricoides TaxID=1046115 RepID=A0ABQ1LQR0_9BACT|nr:antibiotic ABC transporter ATP-binding protein [Marivirga lumbricoides]